MSEDEISVRVARLEERVSALEREIVDMCAQIKESRDLLLSIQSRTTQVLVAITAAAVVMALNVALGR